MNRGGTRKGDTMIDDTLDQPNSEIITWRDVRDTTPLLLTYLFLRIKSRDSNEINFCCGTWDEETEQFLYWVPGGRVGNLLPPMVTVTHWACSEAANKIWFNYPCRDSHVPLPSEVPPGRIL
jgi:hypothetical protein